MISTRRMLKTLASLLPLGALGVSVALAATPAKPIISSGNEDAATRDVAGRLQAIRTAVSEVTAEQAGLQPGDPNIQKAWWGNWRPGWGNGGWRNWHNGWGNGGWGNGGWGNGGWRNGGWGNGGWHNWHNGWGNW
jgi:rSAM-associated Gly-rich repeat protein